MKILLTIHSKSNNPHHYSKASPSFNKSSSSSESSARKGSAFVIILIVGQPVCLYFPPVSEAVVWVTVPERVRPVAEREALADVAADNADEAEARSGA